MKSPITIGITDCGKYDNYANWFNFDPSIKVMKLTWKDNRHQRIEVCDGLVLSGGEDVHPRYYGKPEYLELLNPDYIIEQRDEFELRMMEEALKKKLPVLGICRGLQVANVYFKGTLIPDLPSIGENGHAMEHGVDQRHRVRVTNGSLLSAIVQGEEGEVNSAHHQVADRIGEGLWANAYSGDGVIEGLERKDQANQPFMLLVQWHPERMTDPENPFSSRIREAFVEAVRKV